MEVTLPLMPAGITALLAFLSPYAIAIVNHPSWPAKYKRLVAIVVTVVLAGLSMLLYYAMTGYVFPAWPQFFLLFLLISQAAYALVLKSSAKAFEAFIGTGSKDGKHEALKG
jgi:glucan phosphoethanolaminetransferase (alkaline phosphatase superfamily)